MAPGSDLRPTPPTATREHRRDRLLLLALAALLLLPGLGGRDLWNPDEARYAEVAREMVATGDWLVPHFNGEVYSQKPPLFFWAIAAGGLIGGVDETAARLPSALGALATLLLTFSIARRWFSRRAAWFSVAALATCLKVLWQHQFGQIDMLLTAWVTLALWCFVVGYLEERPRFYLGFFLATGVATLTKGPAGMLPPLLAVLAFLFLAGDRPALRRFGVGRGLLLWTAVVLAWLVPAVVIAGGDYWQQLVLRQNLIRYATPWHHLKPWYYYLQVIPAELAPWSFLLPTALVGAWRRLDRRSPRPEHRGLLFLLCWAAVTLIFFSLSPAKRSVYVLPLYPALAMLVGTALDHLAGTWPRRRAWLLVPLGALGLATLALAAAAPVVAHRQPEAAVVAPQVLTLLLVALGALAVGTVVATLLAWRGRVAAAVATLAIAMVALWLPVQWVVLPALDPVKSARSMAERLDRIMEEGEVYGVYPRLDAGFPFYSHRYGESLETPAALATFAARDERVWILAERDNLARVPHPPALYEVTRDADEREGYRLLTNRPWPGAAGPFVAGAGGGH